MTKKAFVSKDIEDFAREHPDALFFFDAITSGSSGFHLGEPIDFDEIKRQAERGLPVVTSWRHGTVSMMFENKDDYDLWVEWMKAGAPGVSHKYWKKRR